MGPVEPFGPGSVFQFLGPIQGCGSHNQCHMLPPSRLNKFHIFEDFEVFFGPGLLFNSISYCLKHVFGFLDTKPCRTIMQLPQKVNFETETCEIGTKVLFLASSFCLLRLGEPSGGSWGNPAGLSIAPAL